MPVGDVLKITTPLVNKAPQPTKAPEPALPFNLQDITRVQKPSPQGDLLEQNNTMLKEDDTPTILMNLLKDPSVTISYLKNIALLREVIGLVSANNTTLTQELSKMLDALFIQSGDIAPELQRQENMSTIFKGALFDMLRGLLSGAASDKELRGSVAALLRALNQEVSRRDVLDAVANNLQFMAGNLEPSKSLSAALARLAQAFRAEDAAARFSSLKQEAFAVFRDVESSILYTPRLEKVLSIVRYNLSRFRDDPDALQDPVNALLKHIRTPEDQQAFLRGFKALAAWSRGQPGDGAQSSVIEGLTRLLAKQSDESVSRLVGGERMERILESLLSSPCNFTPLLHFIIPVGTDVLRAFAEIWINPNGEEDEEGRAEKGEKCIHLLAVFDIEGIGRFEADVYAKNKRLDLSLLCPPMYVDAFREVPSALAKSISSTGYRLGDVKVDKLERPHSLIEVFRSLPNKRVGVDVRI